VTDDSAIDYHKSLVTTTEKGNFKKVYPEVSDGLIDLLTGML
jgi:hypothetical protein